VDRRQYIASGLGARADHAEFGGGGGVVAVEVERDGGMVIAPVVLWAAVVLVGLDTADEERERRGEVEQGGIGSSGDAAGEERQGAAVEAVTAVWGRRGCSRHGLRRSQWWVGDGRS